MGSGTCSEDASVEDKGCCASTEGTFTASSICTSTSTSPSSSFSPACSTTTCSAITSRQGGNEPVQQVAQQGRPDAFLTSDCGAEHESLGSSRSSTTNGVFVCTSAAKEPWTFWTKTIIQCRTR